jgi:hypothetical protein
VDCGGGADEDEFEVVERWLPLTPDHEGGGGGGGGGGREGGLYMSMIFELLYKAKRATGIMSQYASTQRGSGETTSRNQKQT